MKEPVLIQGGKEPVLIQGGMGAGVSNWRLARAVSQSGQLGVVSGTAVDTIFVRRLQDGDPGGHMLRALDHFPFPEMARRVLEQYFIAGGKNSNQPYTCIPMHGMTPCVALQELTIISNFAEVFLAKEEHSGLIGINYLEKIQTPTLPSLYGAMLAGADYVLMGAGIPRSIPGILDKLSRHEMVSLKLNVEGATSSDVYQTTFDPKAFIPIKMPILKRPKFLAIVSSVVLAITLAKKSSGRIDGFVIEYPIAGGHNAPPRGAAVFNESGEPVYGPRDEVDIEEVSKIGLPFWLAGGYGAPEKFKEALHLGAQGVQVGTAFAYCRESGLTDDIKTQVLAKVKNQEVEVFTDPRASSSGYPFKVVQLENSLSDEDVYENRPRICDLGYLRTPYKRTDGSIGFRCPAEPVIDYLKKGGNIEDVTGRKCLCNALLANIGLPQMQKGGYSEKPLVTSGNAISEIDCLLKETHTSYSAKDVIDYILHE